MPQARRTWTVLFFFAHHFLCPPRSTTRRVVHERNGREGQILTPRCVGFSCPFHFSIPDDRWQQLQALELHSHAESVCPQRHHGSQR